MNERKFPNRYWDPEFKVYLGMIDFLESGKWRNVEVPPPPASRDLIDREIFDLMAKQENHVEREVRRVEILEEAHQVSPKIFRTLMFNATSHPATAALVTAMVIGSRPVVMFHKNHFARPRPCQVDARIEPIIDVPGHPAYPSGHSFQTHLIAHALCEVAPWARDRLFEIAGRVAENREWAGVHYESDSHAGRHLAEELYPLFRSSFADVVQAAGREW